MGAFNFLNLHGSIGDRVNRKIFKLVKEHVPYRHSFYRPHGVIHRPEEAERFFPESGIVYSEVYHDHRTEVPVQNEFFEKMSSHSFFDEYSKGPSETLIYNQSDYGVLKIPGGRLYSNNIDNISVISADNLLIGRFSYQYHDDKLPRVEENKLMRQKYFIKARKVNGSVFSLLAGFGATHNIGHWFFDALPRLHLLKRSGYFDQIDYFVVPSYKRDYEKDSLRVFGIGPEKIIEGKEDIHIQADNLFVSDHPRRERSALLPVWLTEFYRDLFVPAANSAVEADFAERIFISRKDSSLRRVINEDEVMEYLGKFGFKAYELSRLSMLEKVKLFNSAKVIISSSGAGLTCLWAGKPGSQVVEIFAEGFVHTHYMNLAYHAGIKYNNIICKSNKPATNVEAAQLEDVLVPMPELQKVVEKILGSKSSRQA
jgi:capsular polysaccharide biosynthesis protein